MLKRNAFVAGVSRIDPPVRSLTAESFDSAASRGLMVHFEDGRSARLDPADPQSPAYVEILDELRRTIISAYVEVDPVTNVITRVLIPLVVKVKNVVTTPSGDLDVELEISHARHSLSRANANFEELAQELRRAKENGTPMAVTEAEGDHEIIDVRPAVNPPMPTVERRTTTPSASVDLAPRTVTPERALELFGIMSGQTCNPITVPPPCIPFLYPDDGCWGRAHQMGRLMISAGELPEKVWIYGRLQVNTCNNPNCVVRWGWHVAPTLQVSTYAGTELQVIDPALFANPVPEAQWKGVQGDATATLVGTDASVFYRSSTGEIETDPTYAQTARVLATYRLQLKLRSSSSLGPPPYRNCG